MTDSEDEIANADQAADAYERWLRHDGTPHYRRHSGMKRRTPPRPAPAAEKESPR